MIASIIISLFLSAYPAQQNPSPGQPPAAQPKKAIWTAPKTLYAPEPDASGCLRNGKAVIGFTIGIDGRPLAPQVVTSSGNACFDKTALNAVSKYKFTPALKDGVPTEVKIQVEVNYAYPH